MEGCRRANQRSAVLGLHSRKTWVFVPCTVMSMMKRLAALQCLRSGCVRRARHARPAIGLRHTKRAPRLEQQLRQRSEQSGLLSLQQTCPSTSSRMCKWIFKPSLLATVGKENTFGTCVGRVKSGPMTFARFSTDDFAGKISRLRWSWALSLTILWKRLAEPESSRLRTCRSCSITSAKRF